MRVGLLAEGSRAVRGILFLESICNTTGTEDRNRNREQGSVGGILFLESIYNVAQFLLH